MKAHSKESNAFFIENPCLDQIAMAFPQERLQKTLAIFRALPFVEDEQAEVLRQHSPEQELVQWLKLLQWNCVRHTNGSLVLTEFTGRELDLECDPVLSGAVGIVEPGSFAVGHSAHELAPTWWVSYTEQEKQIHQGPPIQERIAGLMVCPLCGSLSPRDWHLVQYTAIRYPVTSVNPLYIATLSEGEVVYESVIKEYVECRCGAELAKNGREIL